MLQSVSRHTNGQQLSQNIIMNQTNGFSNVHNNQISSYIHSAQQGLAGANLNLSDSQENQNVINNQHLYGFQQSNDQPSPIYSSLSLQTNTNIPGHNMQQQIQSINDNQNVKAAYEQVNQLKQLHQRRGRLLMQQMNNGQRSVTPSIPSSNLSSTYLPSHVNNDNVQLQMPSNQTLNNNLHQLPSDNHLQTPQAQPDDVSANINQKLFQLKQQLEQQQQIQTHRENNSPKQRTNIGETKLQMQLRKHIINQQKKGDKNMSNSSSNPSSGKNSPKSCGARRDKKPKKKVNFNGYSSGESSTGSSKKGNNTNTTNKRTFNQSSCVQDSAPVLGNQQALGTSLTQQQKFQMYDHSTEQKRRRLQIASYRQNQVFHTSGNRLIPMLPKSILGVKSSQSVWKQSL